MTALVSPVRLARHVAWRRTAMLRFTDKLAPGRARLSIEPVAYEFTHLFIRDISQAPVSFPGDAHVPEVHLWRSVPFLQRGGVG